jgi:hypothetical protein
MQKTSAEYERLAKSVNKIYETKLDIDGVGAFDGESLISVRTNIALFKGQPKIGTAVSAEIDVSMLMPSAEIPRMACLRPYVRITGTAAKSSAVTIAANSAALGLFQRMIYDSANMADSITQLASAFPSSDGGTYTLSSPYASYSNGKITFSPESGATYYNGVLSFPVDSTEELVSEWIPQGVYFIDTRKTTANNDGLDILTLHGYDAMLKTEQPYASNDVAGDAPDTQYVQAIADAIGVDVDPRTWEIMSGYTIPFPLGYSMREVLGFIAASYVGGFVMTDEGKLRLVSLLGLPEYSRENLLADEYNDIIIFGEDAILV